MSGWSEDWLAAHQSRVKGAVSVPRAVKHDVVLIQEPQSITLTLPLPPSVNAMFANVPGKGRVKTKAYRAWRRAALSEASLDMIGKRCIEGRFKATMTFAMPNGGDVDNRVKAILDLAQACGAIRDDKYLVELHVFLCPGPSRATVTLETVG